MKTSRPSSSGAARRQTPDKLPPDGWGRPGLLGDFRLLLILFVAFRLMMLMTYQPLLLDGVERGVSAGGDFGTYFNLAALSGQGWLPFRDWWSEFPPIPSYLITVVYQLSGTPSSYASFAALLGLLMLIADAGNLALIRRIGTRLHGAQMGMTLAWIYAIMLAPTVFIWWNFEPLVAFCLLMALAWLVEQRETRSAVTAAVGALVKFTPALLIGAVWRFRTSKTAVRYTVIVIAIFALAYGLLLAQNAEMTIPSLTAQFGKASYGTVWALIDGNYRTGNFGPIQDRFDPAKASELLGNPAVIPGWLRLAVAAGIGVLIYARTRRYDARGLVAFVTITLLIFFLQAQGWSTQWQAQIIPLLLLALPTRNTVLGLVLLSLAAFAEYPFLFIRTGETGGEITGALQMPFAILVVARTLILISFCVALYQKLRQEAPAELAP
ncbi:MAG: DUF2029 domain-containing protein [Anaerolineae bacterium]|nr:DUF2029 domain-containing protein [Anaerolineae bacterium]